jgi:UDP-glucose 4-epimerase
MATVVGIFEDCYKRGKKLPVVKPGTQFRRFTHVFDTVKACIFAWKQNKCKHYSIASKQSFSIIELSKMFKSKIRYLPKRKGERFASALTNMNLNNKIIRLSAKIKLKDYIKNFLINNS